MYLVANQVLIWLALLTLPKKRRRELLRPHNFWPHAALVPDLYKTAFGQGFKSMLMLKKFWFSADMEYNSRV